jgi:hypothetical protein
MAMEINEHRTVNPRTMDQLKSCRGNMAIHKGKNSQYGYQV